MKRTLLFALVLVGCTAPEESLAVDPPHLDARAWGGYAAEPEEAPVEVAQPDWTTLPRPRPDAYWSVIDDASDWIGKKTGSDGCDGEFVALPAVSADGSTLALGVGSVAVADAFEARIRFFRVSDGAVLGEQILLGADEWTRLSERDGGMDELNRSYCDRLAELQAKLAGFAGMPVVGAWANPIRQRLPADESPWPHIVSDGATRDVDMAVTDIVIARAHSGHSKLQVRAGSEKRCRGEDGEFAKVWSTAKIAVYTRGPCGC